MASSLSWSRIFSSLAIFSALSTRIYSTHEDAQEESYSSRSVKQGGKRIIDDLDDVQKSSRIDQSIIRNTNSHHRPLEMVRIDRENTASLQLLSNCLTLAWMEARRGSSSERSGRKERMKNWSTSHERTKESHTLTEFSKALKKIVEVVGQGTRSNRGSLAVGFDTKRDLEALKSFSDVTQDLGGDWGSQSHTSGTCRKRSR